MAQYPDVKDRQVSTPSRVRLTAVSSSVPNVYDVEPVPGKVIEIGTKLDHKLFASIKLYIDEQVKNVSDKLISKADRTYVDAALNKKADKTYVDNALGKKADKARVEGTTLFIH